MKRATKVQLKPAMMMVIGGMFTMAIATIGVAEDHHSSKGKPSPTPIAKDVAGSGGRSTGPTHPTPRPTTPPHIGADLRKKMDQMTLKDGNNVVHTEGGVKLIAEVQGGQVTGWKAIGANGKAIPTKITRDEKKQDPAQPDPITCSVCYDVTSGKNKGGQMCYPVDCKNAPPTKQ